ncbi:organic cation transporter protein-like [Achroia grisella]|uniref:organic cation transporter protein-like n=1 Tax=Achroia grisella TaxID=688607 RepID=UPI0027D24B3E|nr:organic cation transporter protein-like [Achroia grisella]
MNYGTDVVTHTKPKSRQNKVSCNVDDLTSRAIGDFGRWQCRISALMALLKLPIAWYQLNIIFLAPPQEFWCIKPIMFDKYSDEEWRQMSVPRIEEFPCLIFDPNMLIRTHKINKYKIPLVECTNFTYDQALFTRTITSEWNLVCSKHWLVHLSQCVMMWGVLLGGIIFGILADNYGRKVPLIVAIILQSEASYISSMIPWYWGWLFVWLILALASGGIGIISFVICMEAVSGKWRTIVPIIYQLPFGLGSSVMAGIAYFFRDWRQLEFILASISAIYILYWIWVPESPRWLLATGQIDKALEVLRVAAIQNKRENNLKDIENLLSKCKGQKSKNPGFIDFFKSKNMRKKTLLLSLSWFCTGLAFYTFSQYLGLIGANIFLTVAWSGIISTPGAILCIFIVMKTGRKMTVWIFQLMTAMCFVFILFTPKDIFVKDWPRLLFAGVGFAGLAGTVPALYLFSGELFPTLGRNAGVGGVTMFARIAAMIAPAVVSLDEILPDLPLILLVITSFIQMLFIVPLPETKNCPLPDTLEEAE